MLRKITIDELRVGMVVGKMDRSWIDHPFLTNRKKITSEGQIQALRDHGIRELHVEANAEAGIGTPAPPPELRDLSAPLAEEIPLREELRYAEATHRKAQTVVRDVMHDVRLGKNVESGLVGRIVEGMIDSIFRNSDALSSMTRLKGYDEYTFVHSVNVAVLCLTLGRHLGYSREDLKTLGIGALLHDTGKIKISASLLRKPGRLDDEEMAEMKRHPLYSAEVLDHAGGIPEEAKQVALQHHERWNGGGYPHGLRGEEIGRFGKVAALCDVYDAMTSDRCYAKGMPPHEGIRKIHEWADLHFPNDVVQRFIRSMGIYPVGTVVLLDTREIGIVTAVNRERVLRPRLAILFRDVRTRLSDPFTVDLDEKNPGDSGYTRTILGPLDPAGLGINPAECFEEEIPVLAG